jgi:hypothetical protein
MVGVSVLWLAFIIIGLVLFGVMCGRGGWGDGAV